MKSEYNDCEPLSEPFAQFCNDRDYTTADVQSDPELRQRLEAEYAEENRSAIQRLVAWCRQAKI